MCNTQYIYIVILYRNNTLIIRNVTCACDNTLMYSNESRIHF